jgi:tRNA A37 threonylcarbamoyltransferase TsaD
MLRIGRASSVAKQQYLPAIHHASGHLIRNLLENRQLGRQSLYHGHMVG